MRAARRPDRRGSILPTLGCCLVAIFSFVALAVDLGMLAVARTQCQNAVDVAALVACRTLDNKQPDNAAYDNNRPAALQAGKDAVTGSPYMAGLVSDIATKPAPVVTVRAGTYQYDAVNQTFSVSYPTAPPAGQSWTAVEVVLTVQQPTYFARLWGINGMPSGARALAVYRPRDIAFALDMTGSMAFSSTFNGGDLKDTSLDNQHMNSDPLAPGFGHYADIQAKIIAPANGANSSGEAISRNNYTITTPGGPPIVRNFFYNPANAGNPVNSAPLLADRTKMVNAFHYGPPETPGDPTNYVSQTYDFTGYDAFSPRDSATPKGPTPAPPQFGTMTDGGGITYVGDRWRRADGSINKTQTSWATGAVTTRTAGTAIDLLGYNVSGGNVRGGTSGTNVIATEAQFRDPTWEAVGYDLDIVQYRADRTTGAPFLPTAAGGTYTPPLLPAADRYKGYSMGPGYWGKTFFIWPPDPRPPVGNPGDANYQPGDFRRRYFTQNGGTAFDPQTDNNTANGNAAGNFDAINEQLFGTGGTTTLRTGTGNFGINYTAILRWIKSGPQVLPPNLRAGRVVYYTSIPDDVNTNSGTTDQRRDKAFWREYIEYVLASGYTSSALLAGPADSWASAAQTITTGDLGQWQGPSNAWGLANNLRPYMRYTDSPRRPRMHFWFGPLSVLDFIANGLTNMNPGTCHEAQCWQLKAGMNSVLDDIRNNHPNDAVGMVMFAYSGYKSIRVPMGQDFIALKNALFFPKSLLSAIRAGDLTSEIRPYTDTFGSISQDEIPNANGSTDPNTGLMLAYNLLSPSSSLPTNPYGTVRGRRGASKIVIFETDGVPNAWSTGTLNNLGFNSYYSGLGNGGNPGNGVEPSMSTAVSVAAQIVKPMLSSGTSGDSGLSLPNAPARVYPIGFGDLFDTNLAPGATFRTTAHQFLSDVGVAGGTLPAGTSTLPSWLVITGSYQNRIDTLRSSLERIFQSGVSVTLIE
jgi:Flp pilus assembly protein TadG